MARTGRRPGASGTREAILDAARRSFAEHGYQHATIRGVADLAGVDPALVHHYFGTKQELFAQAVELPVDLVAVVEAFVRGDRDRIGERIVGLMLSVWDSRTDRSPLIALIRSAVTSENAARMLREFMVSVLFVRLAEALRAPDAPLRASLAASQMMGLLIARYVVRVEPLASAPAAQLVAAIGPNIQRYLTGDLGLG